MKRIVALILVASAVFGFGCGDSSDSGFTTGGFTITSLQFADGDTIPAEYTCDKRNYSPPLLWDGVPDSTVSLALIVDDPDAPSRTFVHWVMYNIPADTSGLLADIPAVEELPNGSRQGISDYGDIGYKGPCPPSGTHRYFFKLYALDTMLDLKGKVDKDELERAIEGHILGRTEMIGLYSRD